MMIVHASLNENDWERLRGEMPFPAPENMPPRVTGIIIKTSELVPEGKVVWHDASGEVIGIEDLDGD